MSDIQDSVPPDTPSSTTMPENSIPTNRKDSIQSASSSSTVTKSVDSFKSTQQKPSGLKPPTKIGRLCSNSAPKPAVPVSPRSDGSSSDIVRKLSDDLSRKHLSDLIEAEEDEVTSSLPDRPRYHRKASTCSTYSITSMDALWEKHARRLSEAGLRRSSDHSVVLTEDTDSFIIGERVWVGGTKPGQIAYIGETQFAPGEWAGIVLDEPIGKNDGSVAGVRYFQCSEKRGVFSRLTRLTRVPLPSHTPHDASPVSDAGSVFERPPSSARHRRTLSPNGSVRSILSSKMNASISTTNSGDLRMGDRVIVSSSRGSKAGTLRYVGITDFASGIWAGVELDDPLGKNDGSVDGKRYFECAPRFGLFAPIAKVSRSPSNRKPGVCAIHSNGRATPLRRSNSRDSLTSLGTSIASSRGVRLGVTSLSAQRVGGPRASSTPVSAKNALQELLREKQHHLERLMRERELERAEVAKVSLQADRAESALAQLKKDANQTNTENEKLKEELHKLAKQLEDERQKVEDLMFRNEEENINKEDYYRYKEAMETEKAAFEARIRELEAEAALQRERADAAGGALMTLEEQRATEAAALTDQHREEIAAAHTLSSELQKLLDEAYALLKEKESEKDSLGKSMSEELNKVKAESEKALNEAKSKISIAQIEFETQLSVVTAKLQLAESKLENEKQNLEKLNKANSQTVIDLNTKLSQLQAALDDKTHELNKVMGAQKEHEVSLNKEITKLKMELSAKILDLEQLDEQRKKHDTTCKSLQDEIAQVKQEYVSKVNEYETLLNETTQQYEKHKSEVVELQLNLSTKTKEYEKLLLESSTASNASEQIVEEYKNTIHERDKEIIKLKDEIEEANASFNIKHSKIAEEHKKEIDERNSKIDQLIKEKECHKQILDQTKIEFETLNSQFTINVDELKTLKEENEKLCQTVKELTLNNNNLKQTISKMELEIGEVKRQYESALEKCTELQRAKENVESEYLNLTGQSTDSNEQFMKLSQHLKETENQFQQLKDKHRETINNHSRVEQEFKQKLFKIQEDYSLERAQLIRSVDEQIEKYKVADSKITQFEAQIVELNNKLKHFETNSDKLIDENSILKQEIEALKVKEQELNKAHESVCKKLEVDIDRYKEEISILRADGVSSEVKLMEKVDQLTEAQNDLNNKLEEARKHEGSLKKIVEDMTAQLNNQKTYYEREIAELNTQVLAANEALHKYKSEEAHWGDLLQDKENEVKDLILKLEMLEVDYKSNLELIAEKNRQVMQVNEEFNKAIESKKSIEEKSSSVAVELTTLKQKYENLISCSLAEESVLKEQIGQLESLQKDKLVLDQEKHLLETKYSETCNELNKLKVENEENLIKLRKTIEFSDDIKKSLQEKEEVLNAQKEQNQSDADKIKHLEVETCDLKKELENKNNLIFEKELQLSKLNETLLLKTTENQQVLDRLQNENVNSNSKYSSEIESLNNTTKTLQNRIMEQEKQLDELKQTKEKVVELQELLIKSDGDIKQLTSINEAQKTNYEDLNKQLQAQYDEYRRESKQINHDLKVELEDYKKELHKSKELIKIEIEKQVQLQQKFTEAEKNKVELSNKLELVSVQQNADVGKDERLEKLTIEIQAIRKSSAEALAKSEEIVNNLKSEIENKIRELNLKDDLVTKLQEDLKNQKAKVEIAERQKALLEKEIAAKGLSVRDNNDNNAVNILQANNAVHTQQIIEEKEMIDGQVSFLNSVIVDMQRKNEQLMARVQVLEGGTVGETPLFNGRKARAVAPRLFCDICDVFDAHDTEDCPRQAADADAMPPPPASGKRVPPPPRPYCDICEVFGHATENCDEEETF